MGSCRSCLALPQISHRRPHLGERDMTEMDSDLLDLPLGVKIPVKPKFKTVLSRGKLGEKLQRPSPFNLDDPYIHETSLQYSCLHDPHLQDYHKRKDILRMLRRQGVITSDNDVVCTAKEFNDYRHYLTRIKLQSEKILGQQEEGLLPSLAKLKDSPKLLGTTDTSCQAEWWPQPQKPYFPHPQKSKETPLKSGKLRRGKIDLDKGQIYSRLELDQEDASTAADSQSQHDNTAAEAQKLQELVEAIVYKVFARLKVPRDQRVSFLRNTAQAIRRSVFCSCMRTEPAKTPLNHHQEMEMVAKELLAMVLESLGNHLESKASEPGMAASWKDMPVDGEVTQANTSKEAETAFSDTARIQAALDKLTIQVVKNVHCLLKSMIAAQFEGDSNCECTEIPELPKG
ncbi:hypothetical protein HGM15179_018631 [Zosterops borbonicus]|uniref:Uncharacterized protein n=1 Tax=Zosterops borbonicus TaxID=364589 RepID=A0A8K1DB16_9PASS|nr:hypothetical protein HGM15179_018631 [Zosterops borbonicus]